MANASTTKRPSQSKDPIDEHDSDTVVAIRKSNMRKRASDASRPETRNGHSQESSWFRSDKRNDSGNLPPRSNQPRATNTQATPISLRPERALSAFEKVHSDKRMEGAGQRARQKSTHGRFMPMNTLSGTRGSQAHAQTRYSSNPQTSAGGGTSPSKRKSNTSVDLSEDELAQPGITKVASQSPSKRQKTEVSMGNSVPEYHSVNRITSTNTYKKISRTSQEAGSAAEMNVNVLPSLKRRQQRQEILARNRPIHTNGTREDTSPYFNQPRQSTRIARQPLQPLKFKSPGQNETRGDGATPIIINSQDDLINGYSSRVSPIVEPLVAISTSHANSPPHQEVPISKRVPSQRVTRPSPSKSTAIDYDHLSERAWQIKAAYSDEFTLDEGKIEFVLNKETGAMGFRLNSKKMHIQFEKNRLFRIDYGGNLLRLHLRGGRGGAAEMVWLSTMHVARTLVRTWIMIHADVSQHEVSDEKIENMFNKWMADIDRRRNGSSSTLASSQHLNEQSGQRRDFVELDFADDLFGASEAATNGQAADIPLTSSKTKLHQRLKDADGTSDPALSSAKIYTNGHVIPQRKSEHNHRTSDSLEKAKASADSIRHAATTGRESNDARETKQVPTESASKPEIHEQGTRTQRLSRSTRSSAYTEREEVQNPKPNTIEKYSKTHGLGPAWSEPLEWPLEAKKRAIVEFEDLERLDEDEFLNDNLVDFAIRWLREKVGNPENIYWFNTYFFSILTKEKGKKINYNAVKKWTKDVDLFKHDYVVVPINENYHWYLAIICNLPALKKFAEAEVIDDTQDHEMREANIDTPVTNAANTRASTHLEIPKGHSVDPALERGSYRAPTDKEGQQIRVTNKSKGRTRNPNLPTIITLDSLGQSHSPAVNILKAYLREEARERLDLSWEKDDLAGMTAKDIPCQENFTDCGIYLLIYVAILLDDPKQFITRLLTKDFDSVRDWADVDPGYVRRRLRRQIRKLHKKQMKQRYPKKDDYLAEAESSDLSDSGTDGFMPSWDKVLRNDKVLNEYRRELDQKLAAKHNPVTSSHINKSSRQTATSNSNSGHLPTSSTLCSNDSPEDSVIIPVQTFTASGQRRDYREIPESPRQSTERGFKDDDQFGAVALPDESREISFPYLTSEDRVLNRHRAWSH